MTQEEVDLIYDYLHENYEYVDGELISTKTRMGSTKGDLFGCLYHATGGGRPHLRGRINLNNKSYFFNVNRFVYIYHHKIHCTHLRHLDDNPFNNRIENIALAISRTEFYNDSPQKNNCLGVRGVSFDSTGKYRATIEKDASTYYLGRYETLKEAESAYLFAKSQLLNNLPPESLLDKLKSNGFLKTKNKIGFSHVFKNRKRFSSRFISKGKVIHVGTFDTPQEAHEAYLKAKAEYAQT
jgi:hypothetical protein